MPLVASKEAAALYAYSAEGRAWIKRYIGGVSREQGTLFLDHLGDWIDNNNVVRMIDAFVDEFDLCDIGFDLAETTGRSRYDPSVQLKLCI